MEGTSGGGKAPPSSGNANKELLEQEKGELGNDEIQEAPAQEKKQILPRSFVPTPSFTRSQKPQIYTITDTDEVDEEEIELHKKLEVLERRLRAQKEESQDVSTDIVSSLYDSLGDVEVYDDEMYCFYFYDTPFTQSTIPKFWIKRIYDQEEELMNENDTNYLLKCIEKAKKVVFIKKTQDRKHGHIYRRLLQSIEENDQKEKEEERKRRSSRRYEPNIIQTAYRRRNRQIIMPCVDWDIGLMPTDDSGDETDLEDFVM